MKSAIEFIFFDCMDTLVRMDVPSMVVYADWAWEGAQDLGLWPDRESFRADWIRERDRFTADNPSLREGTVLGRITAMLESRLRAAGSACAPGEVHARAGELHAVFWRRYREASFILPEVPAALRALREERGLPLGVASNFMVPGGIAELLALHRLGGFFREVVVSCDVGWRTPSPRMYEAMARAAGRPRERILVVGDDLAADSEGPRQFGYRSLLYDPDRRHSEVADRITSLEELPGRV
jgi:HAD superfamily hydrolase (TIGR01549 family)